MFCLLLTWSRSISCSRAALRPSASWACVIENLVRSGLGLGAGAGLGLGIGIGIGLGLGLGFGIGLGLGLGLGFGACAIEYRSPPESRTGLAHGQRLSPIT